LSEEYSHWILPLLPHNVEIMHLVPIYYLPLGVNVINTSALVQNRMQTMKKGSPFANIPQLHPFQNVTLDCTVLPVSPYNSYWNDFATLDPIALKDPHVFIRVNSVEASLELLNTIEFKVHENSDEIVAATFKDFIYNRSPDYPQPVIETLLDDQGKGMRSAAYPVLSAENIKLVILTHGLKEPQARFMREHVGRKLHTGMGTRTAGTPLPGAPNSMHGNPPGSQPTGSVTSIVLHPMVKITKRELKEDTVAELNRLFAKLKQQNPISVHASLKGMPILETNLPQSPMAKHEGDASFASSSSSSSSSQQALVEVAAPNNQEEATSQRAEETLAEEGEDATAARAAMVAAYKSSVERRGSFSVASMRKKRAVELDDEDDFHEGLEEIMQKEDVNMKDFNTMKVGVKRLQEVADTLLIENEHQSISLQSALAVRDDLSPFLLLLSAYDLSPSLSLPLSPSVRITLSSTRPIRYS
jgi:hypothetical protein